MLMKRITSLICGAFLASGSVLGLDVITINGLRVNSDSVLARLKNPNRGQIHALAIANAKVEHRSRLVPGLVALKRPQVNPGGVRALSNDQKARALLNW